MNRAVTPIAMISIVAALSSRGGADSAISVLASKSDAAQPATESLHLEATTPTTSAVSGSPIVPINIP